MQMSVYGQGPMNTDVEAAKKSTLQLEFQPDINGAPLVLNHSYYVPELKDSASVRRLKFYISDISFFKSDKRVAQAEQRFFLFNMEDNPSMQRQIELPKNIDFDEVRFTIGVDSTTQMKGVQGGDLDPMHGMYWTWQSGYINFKLEGQSKSCPGRKNVFQFHIGGFQAPYNSIRNVRLSTERKENLVIKMNLDNVLTKANITENYEVMSPNVKAMQFADQLPQLFTVAQ